MAKNQKKMVMTLEEAETWAERTKGVSWQGWTLLIWKPTRNRTVFMDKRAAFNPDFHGDHKWGILRRVEPNSQGLYVV